MRLERLPHLVHRTVPTVDHAVLVTERQIARGIFACRGIESRIPDAGASGYRENFLDIGFAGIPQLDAILELFAFGVALFGGWLTAPSPAVRIVIGL